MPIRFSLGLIAACFFAFRLLFAHLDVDPQAINILKRIGTVLSHIRLDWRFYDLISENRPPNSNQIYDQV